MNDLVPTARGTRVAALVYDNGTALMPGIVLGLEPAEHSSRLRVLVRIASGEFRTVEYRVPTSGSLAFIRHDYVGLPSDELRQTWDSLAVWDVLEIEAGLHGPHS